MRGTRGFLPALVGFLVVAIGLPLGSPAPAHAAGSVSLAATGAAYVQDFDTLAASGTSSSLPAGWDFVESGTNANTTYTAGAGTSATGDTYSFGAAGATDRALGGLRSGSLAPTIGASFTNNTGSTLQSLAVSFTGEMWRAGVANRGAADRLDFQFSGDATGLTDGTWLNVDALDFSSPNLAAAAGALDGNAAANRASVAHTITGLSIPDGATFWIRWIDFDIASSDDGLAIDDFSLTPAAGDSAPAVVSTTPADEATGVAPSANISITFSEPVNVGAGWYFITCTSGPRSAAVTGGPTTFTLDPNADFVDGDSCAVTVVAAHVSDEDSDDPPDNMESNYVFGFQVATPPPPPSCDDPYTPIYSIQGDGMSAAITGAVTTQGVVVGDFEGSSGLSGFYLQDVAGDGNAATSDGIFVFNGASNSVTAGQVVRVTGFARERFDMTALNGSNSNSTPVTSILDCGTTATVTPTDVSMPFPNAGYLERFEGMLVRFPQSLVIAEYFNFERFGEIVLALPLEGESRPFTPTAIDEPGAPAAARLESNLQRRIMLDDGLGIQNPNEVRHPNGQPFALDNRFRGGDTVTNTIGVLSYDFSLYRIQPTAPADYSAVNHRPTSPEDVGGRLKVAAMNTLNFFITGDYPSGPLDNKCGPANNLECRGHDTDQPAEFERQRTKLMAALAGLDADVIGLNEIENSTGVDPLGDPQGIVAGLNDIFGPGAYDHIDTGVIGTDAIRVGIIYRPDAVTPVGSYETLDSQDDPRFLDGKSRPALAQTFEENGTGLRFTVVVNHLKSKGSACTDVGDNDAGDGQGNCNGTRTLAAQALVDWLATDPTGSGDPDFLIMGDLNAYAQEDPIDAVRAGADDIPGTGDDYTNLISLYQGRYAYSYVFDGMFGYLDHALSSSSMTAQVTGAADWHINADEPDILDYDTSFKPPSQDAIYEPNAYRSSDHDPVVVGLNLVPDKGKITGTGALSGGSFALDAQFSAGTGLLTGSTTFELTGIGAFASTSYDWLVLSGTRATYQGLGTLDGVSGYGFLVSARDGGTPGRNDRIRLKVWDADGSVVFDSQPGAAISAAPNQPLTSGNLTVHRPR